MGDILNILDEFERFYLGNLEHLTKAYSKFLPYNIYQKGDKAFFEMAVAGYTPENLEVTYNDGLLEVVGKKTPFNEEYKLVHQGIKRGDFRFQLPISPRYLVDEVQLKNGVLLVSFIKNEEKVKKLSIKTA